MKKTIGIILLAFSVMQAQAQNTTDPSLKAATEKLNKATTAKEYQQLAGEFVTIAEANSGQWLPWYYAAYCNAKTGWLYKEDGEKIEPFADKADVQIKKAKALLDSSTQQKELSEVYCVMSMANRARVFINPMTYGRQYGPAAGKYTQLARALNPENPRALWLEGWEKYSTPKMWGGDKKKAKELLQQSVQLLSAEQAVNNYPHWGKQDAEALLKDL